MAINSSYLSVEAATERTDAKYTLVRFSRSSAASLQSGTISLYDLDTGLFQNVSLSPTREGEVIVLREPGSTLAKMYVAVQVQPSPAPLKWVPVRPVTVYASASTGASWDPFSSI